MGRGIRMEKVLRNQRLDRELSGFGFRIVFEPRISNLGFWDELARSPTGPDLSVAMNGEPMTAEADPPVAAAMQAAPSGPAPVARTFSELLPSLTSPRIMKSSPLNVDRSRREQERQIYVTKH